MYFPYQSKYFQSSLNLLLERADEWQMRMLSAKLVCIAQAVSGKLRVTNTAVTKVRRCFLGAETDF